VGYPAADVDATRTRLKLDKVKAVMKSNIAKIPALALALLLQCSPLLRVVHSTSVAASAPFAVIFKWVAAVGVVWGSYDAVSGASCDPVRITSPTNSVGTNGLPYSYTITQCSVGTDGGHGFTASNMPPNLSLRTYQNGFPAFAIMSGTPTNFGLWVVRLQAFYTNGGEVLASVPTNLFLSIYGRPVITNQPASVTTTLGGNASFSVVAGGLPRPRYRWRLGTTTLSGQTNSTLALTNVTGAQAGNYTVVISNFLGSVTSAVATLTISTGTGPSILTPPHDATVLAGGTTNFLVIAEGSPPLGYFWRRNGVFITGATGASHALINVSTNDAGAYSVIVSNTINTVTSAVANLYVLRMPFIASIGKASNGVLLEFPQGAGGNYEVLFSPALPTNAWQTLTNFPAQTWPTNVSVFDSPGAQRFYKLRMTIP
jgi:hypothetical protein